MHNTSLAMLGAIAVSGLGISALAQGTLVGQSRCAKQPTAIFAERNATSAVVRLLATNQAVTLSENSAQNGFIGVSAPTAGFVQTVNLRLCAGAPTPLPSPSPTTPPPQASLCRKVTFADGLLVRRDANGAAPIVGGVAANTQVFLTTNPPTTRTDRDGRSWVQINKPVVGWVSNGLPGRGTNLTGCQ